MHRTIHCRIVVTAHTHTLAAAAVMLVVEVVVVVMVGRRHSAQSAEWKNVVRHGICTSHGTGGSFNPKSGTVCRCAG